MAELTAEKLDAALEVPLLAASRTVFVQIGLPPSAAMIDKVRSATKYPRTEALLAEWDS